MNLVQSLERLIGEAELYIDQILQEGPFRVSVSLTDTGEDATIIAEEELGVVGGSEDSDLCINMESQTLEGILESRADFGALIGRSRYTDVRPINFQLLNPERAATANEALKALAAFLFTPGRVKVRRLTRGLAGEAHGAHPIPLVYQDGIRFAWYTVDEGETLNDEGERDPYPQVVVITRGRGALTLEDEEIMLEPGMAVYIPTSSLHMIQAEEGIEALWLAWKAPSK